MIHLRRHPHLRHRGQVTSTVAAISTTPRTIRLSRCLVLLSTAVLAAWSVLMWLGLEQPAVVNFNLGQLARSLAAAAFLTAAAMQCATWRITGDAQVAWSAVSLIILGLTLPLISAMTPFRGSVVMVADPTLPARLLMVFAVMTLAVFTLVPRPLNLGLRPLKIVAPLSVGLGTATAVLVFRGTPAGPPREPAMAIFRVAEWIATAMWTVLAVALFRIGRRQHRIIRLWGAGSLLLMAMTELLRAVALEGPVWLIQYSAGFQLLAAVIATCTSAVRLWNALAAADTSILELNGHLFVVRADLVDVQQREAERLHDARTAVVSLMGASKLLNNADIGQQVDREQLDRLMTAELRRLEALLDPGSDQATRPFRLADAVEPLVLAHRISGAAVNLEIDDCWAQGRVAATATAVANLLSNARAHAPGATVTITAGSSGSDAVIRVEDDGPGIPIVELPDLLTRGARGSTARGPGSGFGLHTAAHAMSHQGGSLEVAERPGGGTSIVLTLAMTGSPVDQWSGPPTPEG